MRRRVRILPFNVIIPPEKRDSRLKDRLLQELPGILNWALQGCLQWQQLGSLAFPSNALEQAAEYIKGQDVIGGFIEEECLISADYREAAQRVWRAYQDWCAKTGNRSSVRGRNGFYQELKSRD
jgi:putative DNA primase/helicase